uniref:Uncharacterized protein n=1 Tax=Romanomermis culicivorax TaxID=13658 RepID=A0A915I6T3_ROMCU
MKNVDDETLIEDGTNNDPYEKEDDGDNVADDDDEQTFVLQDELIKYCNIDVDILLKACMKFRDLFMATVDPFENC